VSPDPQPTFEQIRQLVHSTQESEQKRGLDYLAERYLPLVRIYSAGRIPHDGVNTRTDVQNNVWMLLLEGLKKGSTERGKFILHSEGEFRSLLKTLTIRNIADLARTPQNGGGERPTSSKFEDKAAGPLSEIETAEFQRIAKEFRNQVAVHPRKDLAEALFRRVFDGAPWDTIAQESSSPYGKQWTANTIRMAVARFCEELQQQFSVDYRDLTSLLLNEE
jgi:hypothetical protein